MFKIILLSDTDGNASGLRNLPRTAIDSSTTIDIETRPSHIRDTCLTELKPCLSEFLVFQLVKETEWSFVSVQHSLALYWDVSLRMNTSHSVSLELHSEQLTSPRVVETKQFLDQRRWSRRGRVFLYTHHQRESFLSQTLIIS